MQSHVRYEGDRPLRAGALATGAVLLLAPHVGYDEPLVLIVLIATSSAAVSLPIVQGLRRADEPILVATSWIVAADIATVLAIPLVLATGRIARVVAGGVIVITAAAIISVTARCLANHPVTRSIRDQSRKRGWAIDLRMSILVLFTLAWAATRFGTSILIAGFATGAIVALLGEPRRVAQQLVGLGEGLFIPVFFVDLGARLDPAALLGDPRALILGSGMASVVRQRSISSSPRSARGGDRLQHRRSDVDRGDAHGLVVAHDTCGRGRHPLERRVRARPPSEHARRRGYGGQDGLPGGVPWGCSTRTGGIWMSFRHENAKTRAVGAPCRSSRRGGTVRREPRAKWRRRLPRSIE